MWLANCVYISEVHKIGSLVSKNVLYKLCNKRLKYVKFLKTVYWRSLVNKCKSRYGPVVYGAMGFYLFTGDVGVLLCFCSVGVGVLSSDLARWNYLVELWTVLSGKGRWLFLLLCYTGRIIFPLGFSPDVNVEFLVPLIMESLQTRCSLQRRFPHVCTEY